MLNGVACQVVHQTVDAWRQTAATVLEQLDTSSPSQKALVGLTNACNRCHSTFRIPIKVAPDPVGEPDAE